MTDQESDVLGKPMQREIRVLSWWARFGVKDAAREFGVCDQRVYQLCWKGQRMLFGEVIKAKKVRQLWPLIFRTLQGVDRLDTHYAAICARRAYCGIEPIEPPGLAKPLSYGKQESDHATIENDHVY